MYWISDKICWWHWGRNHQFCLEVDQETVCRSWVLNHKSRCSLAVPGRERQREWYKPKHGNRKQSGVLGKLWVVHDGWNKGKQGSGRWHWKTQVRAGSWKALKTLPYLPTFRQDLAQMLCDVCFTWYLVVNTCQVLSHVHWGTVSSWLSVTYCGWQAGDSSEVKSCAEAEIKCLCCHIIFDSFMTTGSPPPHPFT